jgi:hypothetical protein
MLILPQPRVYIAIRALLVGGLIATISAVTGTCRAAVLEQQAFFAMPAPSELYDTKVSPSGKTSLVPKFRKLIWKYRINQGRTIDDGEGNLLRFGGLRVRFNLARQIRVATVSATVSGKYTGTLEITERTRYRIGDDDRFELVRSTQTISQTLNQDKKTGDQTMVIGFRPATELMPPRYSDIFALPLASAYSLPTASGQVSATLNQSSRPNKASFALRRKRVKFGDPLGWSVTEKLDSLIVRNKSYTNVAVLTLAEPRVPVAFSTAGCPASASDGCLVSPEVAGIKAAKAWVASGIGTIRYEGPFFAGRRTVGYELVSTKKTPAAKR